jgi:amino acid adenylation domain-containing protein
VTDPIEAFALSPQQRALWQSTGGAPPRVYADIAVTADGAPTDLDALADALRDLAARHEILRTCFRTFPGMRLPLQVVEPDPAAAVRVQHVDADGALARLPTGPADLEKGPCVEAWIAADGPRHRLLLSLPALCADEATLRLLPTELADAYARRTAGTPPREPAEYQYPDIAAWQSDLLTEAEGAEGRAFWERRPEPAAVPRLPCEKPAGASAPTTSSHGLPVPLSAETVEQLTTYDAPRLASFALACLQALLFRHAGLAEPTVAVAHDGRHAAPLRDALGPLGRLLPITARIGSADRIEDLRLRAAAELELAAPFQDYAAPADTAHAFTLEVRQAPDPASGGGSRFSLLSTGGTAAPCLLGLVVSAEGPAFELRHDPARIDEASARILTEQLAALVAQAALEPHPTVGELDLLPPKHAAALAASLTGAEAAGALPVPDLILAQAARTPDAVAVRSTDRVLSYAQLVARAAALARRLTSLGAGPEAVVGLFADRSADAIAGLLGIWLSGAAYLPLEPAAPDARRARLLADAGACAVVGPPDLGSATTGGRPLVVPDDAEADADVSAGPCPPNRLAYVIYTSGSTGTPKGVEVEHGQLASYRAAVSERLGLEPGHSFAVVSTLAADLAHTALFPTLCLGGTLHLPPPDIAAAPARLAGYLAEHRVDGLKIVPSQLATLLDVDPGVVPRARLVLGGEASDWALVDRVREAAPHCRVFNHYGPTETTVGVLAGRVDDLAAAADRPERVPLGAPLAGVRISVLDERGRQVPVYGVGELHIGGTQVARGYRGDPERTAECFIADPFDAAVRLYRTGDLCRVLPDGGLVFLGRGDDQVKVLGFRVEPGEVAAALRALPGIKDAVVLPRDAPGGLRLVAYAVVDDPAAFDAAAARTALEAELPGAMVPSAVVPLVALPLTPNGKIDRAALADVGLPSAGSSPPRDLLELELVRLWEDLLGVRGIGVRDNFFTLGGHSLLAVRLMAEIERRFDQDLPLYTLFEGGTVEDVAEALRAVGPVLDWSPLVRLRPGAGRPVFLVHAGGGNVFSYIALARRLRPDLDVYALQCQGLDGAPAEPLTLPDMAAGYVDQLRRVQPEGPYLLSGWCMGAIVAYEMARQLVAAGQRVALLASLDGPAPRTRPGAHGGADHTEDDDALVSEAVLTARFAWHYTLPLDPEDLLELSADEQLDRLLAAARQADLLPPDCGMEQLRVLLRVYKRNIRTVRGYFAEPYPGEVLLIRAEQGVRIPGKPLLGWDGLAQRVEVRSIPGDHHSIMRAPQLEPLADLLNAALAERGEEERG